MFFYEFVTKCYKGLNFFVNIYIIWKLSNYIVRLISMPAPLSHCNFYSLSRISKASSMLVYDYVRIFLIEHAAHIVEILKCLSIFEHNTPALEI